MSILDKLKEVFGDDRAADVARKAAGYTDVSAPKEFDKLASQDFKTTAQAVENTKFGDGKAITTEVEAINNDKAYQEMMDKAKTVNLDGPMLDLAARFGKELAALGAASNRAEVADTGQLSSTRVASADKVDQKFKDKLAGLDEGIA